jgi:hypothetical protein
MRPKGAKGPTGPTFEKSETAVVVEKVPYFVS